MSLNYVKVSKEVNRFVNSLDKPLPSSSMIMSESFVADCFLRVRAESNIEDSKLNLENRGSFQHFSHESRNALQLAVPCADSA